MPLTKPVEPGKYQTRNGRMVVIDKIVEIYDRQSDAQIKVADGRLLAVSAGVSDEKYQWSLAGNFRTPQNQGVPHIFDLEIAVRA
jgi:hypothetical protein